MRLKKLIALILTSVCLLALSGCGKNDTFKIKITVPAGSTELFAYSDEEISAKGNKITIYSGEGLGDTEVILKPVDETAKNGYAPTYITPGMPVTFDAVKGEWFKVGVSSMRNESNTDFDVYIEVEGVNVRIE